MSNTSENSKRNCDDSYVLPTGPKGKQGSNGTNGAPGRPGRKGPKGETGSPGKSKIDINFSAYKFPGRTITHTDNALHGSQNEVTMLGTFIYPGNEKFGGDPTFFTMLVKPSIKDINIATSYNQVFKIVRITPHLINQYTNNNYQGNKVSIPDSLIDSNTVYNTTIKLENDNIDQVVSNKGTLSSLPDEECLLGIFVGNIVGTSSTAEYTITYYGFELY